MRVALVCVLAAAVLAGCGGGRDESAAPPGLLDGIPQQGVVLGDPAAPVTLVEFADVQCPYCARFSAEALPPLVRDYVRPGKVRLVLRGVAFLGPDSEAGLRALLAAGRQGKLWHLLDLLYRHQGEEGSGWLTDELLRRVGARVDGLDVQRMLAERDSAAVEEELRIAAEAAVRARVDGTPTFWAGPTGKPLRFLGKGAIAAEAVGGVLDRILADAVESA